MNVFSVIRVLFKSAEFSHGLLSMVHRGFAFLETRRFVIWEIWICILLLFVCCQRILMDDSPEFTNVTNYLRPSPLGITTVPMLLFRTSTRLKLFLKFSLPRFRSLSDLFLFASSATLSFMYMS